MLKGIYKQEKGSNPIEKQIGTFRKEIIKCGKFAINTTTLKNIPIGNEHSCDFPVLLVCHSGNFLYIYPYDGHNGKQVYMPKVPVPCGIVKFNPQEEEKTIFAGPMFKENWLAEQEQDGFTDLKMSLRQTASYLLMGETQYKLKGQ